MFMLKRTAWLVAGLCASPAYAAIMYRIFSYNQLK